ncbi:MAG TPA: methyltransferase domain-containing protein [Candidatus Eisenbergiella merdavium]|uniref:Methyltransferase domain-containing protein n=1 Tax=Candidatus Eisenbergiella merdavium TaxID=2838551 RepID=A0A9D2NGQ9_9FIRM|nr:methyltransferase domain-containing protein [Candidatus Eisenbergiella merdavium]
MNEIIGKNIYSLRKKQGLTQERLAELVNVSFQAVSKWENGNSVPDVSTLPLLANVLHCSIDSLLGYAAEQRRITDYEERYKTNDYYWGIRPSHMCYEVMKLCPPVRPLRLLDVACGEGKDAVFFARNGYHVTAFDAAGSGLEKARRLSDRSGTEINFFQADMLDFRLEGEFDIIFCSGSLHYIPQRLRKEILENYQAHTSSGGLHALNVFVRKPFVKSPSDEREHRYKWLSGELFTYYSDWLITACGESIFDCMSGGTPHKHCMDTLYAIKQEGPL